MLSRLDNLPSDFFATIPPIRASSPMCRNWQGSATSAEPQPTNTLDFWKYKFIPYPLHMGMGLCYNLFYKFSFDEVA